MYVQQCWIGLGEEFLYCCFEFFGVCYFVFVEVDYFGEMGEVWVEQVGVVVQQVFDFLFQFDEVQ